MAAIPPSFQPQEKCNHEIVPHYERKIAQLTAERDAAIAERDEACETAKERRDEAIAALAQADKLAEALAACAHASRPDDVYMASMEAFTALKLYEAWKRSIEEPTD